MRKKLKRILKKRNYLDNRYVFYIVYNTLSAVLSWLIIAIFSRNEYLSFKGEGVTFLFILLWINYHGTFYLYELRMKNKKKK